MDLNSTERERKKKRDFFFYGTLNKEELFLSNTYLNPMALERAPKITCVPKSE